VSKQTEILCEIVEERGRQDLTWGEQNHPIKPSGHEFTRRFVKMDQEAKESCNLAASTGNLTWYDILWEEFCEVFAEDAPAKQREELKQLNAVSLAMIEYLDRRYPKKDE
jgi:hypothetical protein